MSSWPDVREACTRPEGLRGLRRRDSSQRGVQGGGMGQRFSSRNREGGPAEQRGGKRERDFILIAMGLCQGQWGCCCGHPARADLARTPWRCIWEVESSRWVQWRVLERRVA